MDCIAAPTYLFSPKSAQGVESSSMKLDNLWIGTVYTISFGIRNIKISLADPDPSMESDWLLVAYVLWFSFYPDRIQTFFQKHHDLA